MEIPKNYKDVLIFIVEDDPTFNKLIETHLKKAGFKNIMTFNNGEDCVANIHEKPAIILEDFDLGEGMNGLDVLKKVKSIDPQIEFIFLSGQDDVHVAVEIMQNGAFDYVVKDQAAKDNILSRISKVLKIKGLIKDKRIYKTVVVLLIIFHLFWAVILFLLYG
jgi:DNA-binding NtrC family response regulator